eukprot:4490857-Pyramimonas_sp.AAC.1
MPPVNVLRTPVHALASRPSEHCPALRSRHACVTFSFRSPPQVVSTCLMVVASFFVTVASLPAEFDGIFLGDPARVVLNWHVYFCVCCGLGSGLAIGLVTEYYTSHAFEPVKPGRVQEPRPGGL